MIKASDRELTKKDLAYEALGYQKWSEVISYYDTHRRISVLVDDFLGPAEITNKICLDAGCGLGDFTQALIKYRPKELVATDLAPSLVESVQKRFDFIKTEVADLMVIDQVLGSNRFDTIVCSEVIEHTPDPLRALKSLSRCLKVGGKLSLSVPNLRWKWSLKIAQALGIRNHYQGYENWVEPKRLLREFKNLGLKIVLKEGIHLVPWHVMPKALLTQIDKKFRSKTYGWSVNLAVLAQKEHNDH